MMFGFKNFTMTKEYELSADGFLNLTNCEDLNLSLVDYSCMNLSNEFHRDMKNNDMAVYFDTINLVESILEKFKYTVCPHGLIVNILNIIAITNAPSRLTPHSRLVISLAVSDMCIVLPEIVNIIILNKFEYDSISYKFAYFYFEPSVALVL